MVTPLLSDDWEAHPINSFELEFRRTVAAIRYYEEKLAELQEQELVYDLQSVVAKAATEFPGTDTTYAVGVHQLELARRWERQHLTDLHELWITAKLDMRKLEIEQRYVEQPAWLSS
ncbi:MAG: hypothetical protein M3O28_01015 [Actinomycetota bacterium]|nr:hypothetical protein [Actinomycetota bacterium]